MDGLMTHYKRAKPTQTDPEDDRNADPSLPMGSRQRPMTQERMVASGSGRTVARSGRIHLHLQDIGGQVSDTRGISRAQLAILQKPARQPMFSEAFVKQKAVQ